MNGLKKEIKDWIIKDNEGHQLGVSDDNIEQLEKKYKITFPQAYKEFLQLTGQYFAPLAGIGGHYIDYIEKFQSDARENLKEYGLEHLMPEHYWVIAEWDGSIVIVYIDLDQGDDPPVYGLNIEEYAEEPSEQWKGTIANKFSDWINEKIAFFEEHGHS